MNPVRESLPAWSFHSRVLDAQPDTDTLILVGDLHSRPLKLTGLSRALALEIKRGGGEPELLAILAKAYPRHPESYLQRALQTYIGKLTAAGLLEGEQGRTPGRWSLPNPDPLAHALAQHMLILPARLRRILLYVAVMSSLAFVAMALEAQPHWREISFSSPSHWLFCGSGVLLWLILHEFAHAVVCRMHGCPVSGAGLMLRGLLLPSPYINTSAIHLFPGDAIRLHVAVAGPLLDLLFSGAVAAWLIAMPASVATPGLQALLVWVLLGLYFNLTPFRVSDGSNAFDAFFAEARRVYRVRPGRPHLSVLDNRQRAYAAYSALYITFTAFAVTRIAGWALP